MLTFGEQMYLRASPNNGNESWGTQLSPKGRHSRCGTGLGTDPEKKWQRRWRRCGHCLGALLPWKLASLLHMLPSFQCVPFLKDKT